MHCTKQASEPRPETQRGGQCLHLPHVRRVRYLMGDRYASGVVMCYVFRSLYEKWGGGSMCASARDGRSVTRHIFLGDARNFFRLCIIAYLNMYKFLEWIIYFCARAPQCIVRHARTSFPPAASARLHYLSRPRVTHPSSHTLLHPHPPGS